MANGKWLIDATELKNFFGFMRKMWSASEIIHVINEADAVDAVEVVRCKDCKLAVDYPSMADSQKLVCTKSVNWRTVEPDHFCSYGERKENDLISRKE